MNGALVAFGSALVGAFVGGVGSLLAARASLRREVRARIFEELVPPVVAKAKWLARLATDTRADAAVEYERAGAAELKALERLALAASPRDYRLVVEMTRAFHAAAAVHRSLSTNTPYVIQPGEGTQEWRELGRHAQEFLRWRWATRTS